MEGETERGGGGKGEEPLAGLKRRVGFIVRQIEAGKHKSSLKNLHIPPKELDVFVLSFHLWSHESG